MTLPADSVIWADFTSTERISAKKLKRTVPVEVYFDGLDSADGDTIAHIVNTATATVKRVLVMAETIPGVDRTVEIDVLKASASSLDAGGSWESILGAANVVDENHTSFEVCSSVIATPEVYGDEILRVTATRTGAAGGHGNNILVTIEIQDS